MYGLGTHLGDELVGVIVRKVLVLLGKGLQDVQVFLLCEKVTGVLALVHTESGLDDHVTLIIYDALEFLGTHAEQVADLVGQALEIPDMDHGHHQFDVAHTLPADLLLRYFHAATVANDALVPDTLVLTARALIILDRAKYPLAEQAIALRLVGPVVDGLRLEYLAEGTLQDGVRGSQADRDL